MSMPYRSILLPVDLTPLDPSAIRSVHTLMTGNDAKIHVFHVLNAFEEVPMGFPIPPVYYREIDLAAGAELEKQAELFKDFGSRVSLGLYRGRPDQVILEVSVAMNADLILLLSHGKGLFGRMLVGSTSTSVIHHAPIPVLLLKPEKVNGEIRRQLQDIKAPENFYGALASSAKKEPSI